MDKKDPLEILARLIAVDTQSSKSNFEIIDFLANLFLGFKLEKQNFLNKEKVKGENLIVKINGKYSSKALIFLCHTDTIPTSSRWLTDPFRLVEKNNILYGLGVCDTKGGIASLISAIFSLNDTPQFDTYIVFDGDEELYSAGARNFLDSFNVKNPHFIFLEPTLGNVSIGQRALLKFDIITTGTAIHSSQATPLGNSENNAIFKMNKILTFLSKDAETVFKIKDEILGATTQNFGAILGGTARNILAQNCNLVLERRIITKFDPEKEFARIKKSIAEIDKTAQVILDEIEPGFLIDKNSSFVKNILKFSNEKYPEAKVIAFEAWSEAGLFANKYESIILGPGDLKSQAHRANESVSKQEILDFTKIFKDIILNVEL